MLEVDIETAIRTAIVAAVDGLLTESVKVVTFWAEPTYAAGDEEQALPAVTIHAEPSSRETAQMSHRNIPVTIECATFYRDDLNRSQLVLLYGRVRFIMETTAFDFGANVTYSANSYEIPSPGVSGIEDGFQTASFQIEFNVCAEAYDN